MILFEAVLDYAAGKLFCTQRGVVSAAAVDAMAFAKCADLLRDARDRLHVGDGKGKTVLFTVAEFFRQQHQRIR